ncbi:MAG: hypothetical protein ACI9MR_000007 [Myxococcota bacterium]|jgi:hypothetical protein
MPLSTLCSSLRYGFAIQYFATIEGIPNVLIEHDGGTATAPTNYGLDASLIVDKSSRVGGVVDPKTMLASAYDFTFRFLDTTYTRSLFTRPALMVELTADITATATSMVLTSVTGLATSGTIYIGTSAMTYTGITDNTLTGLTRGLYGDAKAYKALTVVSDAPRYYVGRSVQLYAVLVDPLGRYVMTAGSDLTSQAALIFDGYIATRPARVESTWEARARSLERRLAEPLSPAMEGAGFWDLQADPLVTIDPTTILRIEVSGTDASAATERRLVETVTFKPFAALSAGVHRLATVRAAMAAAWATIQGGMDAAIGLMTWAETLPEADRGTSRQWRCYIGMDADDSAVSGHVYDSMRTNLQWFGPTPFSPVRYSGYGNDPGPATLVHLIGGTSVPIPIAITFKSSELTALLTVRVDGLTADIPATGWIRIGDDSERGKLYLYDSLEVSATQTNEVTLAINVSTPVDRDALGLLDFNGELDEVGVEFIYKSTGTIPDVMRRMIQSSGVTSAQGTFDTGPGGSGYAVGTVNEASFDEIFDGAYLALTADVAVSADTSFAKVWGGLMRLSRRGIAAVPTSTGAALQITAVDLSPPGISPSGGVTLTDAHLIAGGDGPVKAVRIPNPPASIELKFDHPEHDDGMLRINYAGYDGKEFGRTADRVTIYGTRKASFEMPAYAWARAQFVAAETRQMIELKCVPWYDAKVGQVIALDIEDPHLWNYATGTPGYAGPARVWGSQTELSTQVLTLTLELSGDLSYAPLSPSVFVDGYTTSATAPTAVSVDTSYVEILTSFGTAGNFTMSLYKKGTEGVGSLQTLTISAVSDAGSLTVASLAGVFDLSAGDWYLTLPRLDLCNTEQAKYLHVSQTVRWS